MTKTKSNYDAVIIGCGIAGASAAYFLSEQGATNLLILEKEEQPGFHATGRAAGVLAEFDLTPSTMRLKQLGGQFLRDPPPGFAEHPLLEHSGILMMFQGELWDMARRFVPDLVKGGTKVVLQRPEKVKAMVPVVSELNFDGALYLPEDGRIDVHELLWGYLRHAKRRGAELRCGEEVRSVMVRNGRAVGVATDSGEYRAKWVVNAAGAWGSRVRLAAGETGISLTPLRRTIITFAAPEGLDVRDWPFCVDETYGFYFSPESAGLLASPMDEDPVEPGDVHPDELVVAETIERLKKVAPALTPKSLKRTWAGLRTFAPDHVMVVGEDEEIKGFFWLSGQGGAGIETSGAVGRIAADLMVKGATDLMDVGPLSPTRFNS